ncbi:hypothetical protein EDEG_03129 [Edhazardia aedis USNM 41457]|uniref:Seipin n=1 Tax=Edhazardia aedis (strain USNM 41457) TaxID=1003232 RepID=J9D3P7_EDHAE|nr:hypothetical protein EDEG_03129 [Edhazardia aedis USNM 41457]|eukprot:EJW02456.1 hypothetical protein EDEG_03129 [Edhazardia aedis USNM 41457]
MRKRIMIVILVFTLYTCLIPILAMVSFYTVYEILNSKIYKKKCHIKPYFPRNDESVNELIYMYKITSSFERNACSTLVLDLNIQDTFTKSQNNTFFLKSIIDQRIEYHHLSRKIRHPVYYIIDTIMFYPLLKLGIYENSQNVYCEIKLPSTKNQTEKMEVEFFVENGVDLTEAKIHIISKFRFWHSMFYKHNNILKIILYVFISTAYFDLGIIVIGYYFFSKTRTVNENIDEVPPRSIGEYHSNKKNV